MAMTMFLTGEEVPNVIYKPCPFCGGTNITISDEKHYNNLCAENGGSMLSIRCSVCDTEVHLYDIPNNNYWMGVGMILAKWNSRHSEKGEKNGN